MGIMGGPHLGIMIFRTFLDSDGFRDRHLALKGFNNKIPISRKKETEEL